MQPHFIVLIIVLLFIFVLKDLFLSYIQSIIKDYKSAKWIPVEALITESYWKKQTSVSSYSDGVRTSVYYLPIVTFLYTHEGEEQLVTSTNELGLGELKEVEQTLRDFPAGSPVTCYVNPSNAGEAVLKPGLKLKSSIEVGAILLLFIALLIYVVVSVLS